MKIALLTLVSAFVVRPASSQSTANVADIFGPRMQQKVDERLEHSLQNEKRQREQVGQKAAELIEREGSKRAITIQGKSFQEMPARHPLLANDGADPNGKSQREYTKKDTEAIFNDETFGQCLEDRQVFNQDYLEACAQACPGEYIRIAPGCPKCDPRFDPFCFRNEYYVSEMYFPIYQTRTYPGRALGSFDPAGSYLSGSDKRQDLKLQATKQRLHTQGKQVAEELVAELIGTNPSSVSDKLYPDWYTPELEWYGHDGNVDMDLNNPDSYHTLTYQTNAHRQATRRRPKPEFLGYQLEKDCLFHTLDNPAKDVVSAASYGEREYLRASMAAKETQRIDPQAAQAVLPKNVQDAISFGKSLKASGSQLPQEIQQLTPSQRARKWNWLQPGLQRVGVQPGEHQKDYVFYGHTLAPFNTTRSNAFVDPFYAAISQGFSHYMLSASPDFPANKPLRRALQFSYHTARPSRTNYSGEDPQVEDKIIFTDKMQIIFPPWQDGGTRRGSHCFRPESIAKLEPGKAEGDLRSGRTTSSRHFSLPLEIRKRFPEKSSLEEGLAYANEVRIAYYIKRVNCYCTLCGVPSGCNVLNDGDQKEDNFYGTTPLANASPILFIGGSTRASGRLGRRSAEGERRLSRAVSTAKELSASGASESKVSSTPYQQSESDVRF